MKRALVVLLGMMFVGVFAGQALAVVDPGQGWVEVCKQTTGTPALVGSFRFAITDSVDATKTIEVPVGFCSAPIQVAAGPATVTELGSLAGLKDDATVDSNNPQRSFVSVVSATAIGQTGSLGSFDGLWTESIDVPASSPDSQVSTIQASTITVTFTDQLVTGVIEVCKNIVPGSELTGNFQFTISGANGFSTQRSVPVGACSPGVSVPAGKVEVQETGDLATNVTAITAIQTAQAVDATLGPDATAPLYDLAGAVTVAAVTAGDSSVQTLITFTNDSVRLKLCKIWDSSAPLPVPAFPFSPHHSRAGRAKRAGCTDQSPPRNGCGAELHPGRNLPRRDAGRNCRRGRDGHEGLLDHGEPVGHVYRPGSLYRPGRRRVAERCEPYGDGESWPW